jgi:hypothetical protein
MSSQHRSRYGTVVGLTLYAAIVIIMIALFALYQFPQSSADNPSTAGAGYDHRHGTILLRSAGGDCQQMNFNNSTGAVREGALVPCSDSMPGVNSTEGRMNAIRDAFSKK